MYLQGICGDEQPLSYAFDAADQNLAPSAPQERAAFVSPSSCLLWYLPCRRPCDLSTGDSETAARKIHTRRGARKRKVA